MIPMTKLPKRRNLYSEREESKMKNFKTILKFELDNYFKSKSYVICTLLICLVSAICMFIPRITESFKDDDKSGEVSTDADESDDLTKMAIYDPNGIGDMDMLAEFFADTEFTVCQSQDEVAELVSSEKAKAGFVINTLTDFDYYVYNKSVYDENANTFTEYMSMLVKLDYCAKNNLDVEEYLSVEYAQITANENILGKDSISNYGYCYALIVIVFMLIIMYGTTIASGITNEKSNRSIEILVTSTSSTALLFGKVFAGAIASIFQVGIIAASALGSYQYNKEYWGDVMAMFFDIPTSVIVTFAIFGIGGYLIYAFFYGALGALVSKSEDLNKTAGTDQMFVMLVYMITLIQLTNIDGTVMKVCSFIPFSSYSAMFARVAMGSVETWEIVVSAVILYVSVVIMGFIGGKIFRNSTLRYGNPIKLSNALKGLKKKD